MTSVLLSLGSNLGDKMRAISRAVELLTQDTLQEVRVSSFYETAPVGFIQQPSFINIAVSGWTKYEPEILFKVCKTIEQKIGRKPRPRWHEREIDIDIILYGLETLTTEVLAIPHPQMHNRRFVLVPSAEIVPTMIHPILNTSIEELLELCEDVNPVKKIVFLKTQP